MSENKTYDKLISFLDENKAHYRLIDHISEGRTDIISPIRGNKLSAAAKCIIMMLKVGKKETKYILGVVPGDAKVNLDGLKDLFKASYISFATTSIAEELAGCVSGTVLPFAFNQDLELIVDPLLLENEEIFFNAARLDQSMALKTTDYVRLAKPRLENIADYSVSKPKENKITKPKSSGQEELERMRHSCAHLVAAAVQKLYPQAKFGVGPVIENGFYYDVDFGSSISDTDLIKIENVAKNLAKEKLGYVRKEMPIDVAIEFFGGLNQVYKVELLKDLKEKGTTKVNDEEMKELAGSVESVSVYTTGSFTDLCRGPHLNDTSEIGAFKLTKLAGAYWRGKSENPQLTRIYGVCFAVQTELDEYLHMLEEAEKRDHRKIGAEQDLFFFDDKVGKGLVMWLPNGTIIRNEVERLATEFERAGGYVRVRTPHLAKEEMFLTSGHLPYYKDSMYPAMEMDDGTYYLKAMNCPHHHTIYNHNKHSYRDLPLRIAEYGECYRNELSGTLAGLLRVRCMAMNDAHIYCRKDQIKAEIQSVLKLMIKYFKIFGLENYWFRLSKWSPSHLEKYINQPENWEFAEGVIREVLQEMKAPFVEVEDEAAFYGPKVDVMFKSIVGREETMSTVQLDFAAKQRFGLSYTDDTGADNNEVFVIHRAPLSTHERFMAFLIEHFGGRWPVWMSPVQVVLVPVSENHAEGASKIKQELFDMGVRVESDDANETLGNRVRKAANKQVPYIIVVGDKELSGEDWMIRVRGQKDQIKMSKADFLEKLQKEIKERL